MRNQGGFYWQKDPHLQRGPKYRDPMRDRSFQ
jgi:hypothetical protein